MPSTTDRELTLITKDTNTTVKVTYNAVFSPFERHLAAMGLQFKERIEIIGIDPPGTFTGTAIIAFPTESLPVTDGPTAQTISRTRTLTVPRSSLQEDPALGDADEIRCKVRIQAIGLPPAFTADAFTNQEVLVG